MTPEQQPNTPPQPPQGRPAPQPGMAQPPLPQQPDAPQPWPAQQPPAAQPWPPQQPPQAWGAPQQPPAGPQDRQGVLERHHVHHSYIWLGSIQTAVMLLVVVLFSMGSAIVGAISEGDAITSSDGPVLVIVGLCVAGGLVLVVGLVALYQWVSYKHLYYELGPEEFNLYSGIFNKKRVHVPYQRIQSVDQRASLAAARVRRLHGEHRHGRRSVEQGRAPFPYVQKSQGRSPAPRTVLRASSTSCPSRTVPTRPSLPPPRPRRQAWPCQALRRRRAACPALRSRVALPFPAPILLTNRQATCWTLLPSCGTTCGACSAASHVDTGSDHLRVRHVATRSSS